MTRLDEQALFDSIPEAVSQARARGVSAVQILAERFSVDPTVVGASLAHRLDLPFVTTVDGKPIVVLSHALQIEIARKRRLAHGRFDEVECLFTEDPLDEDGLQWAMSKIGRRLPLRVAPAELIDALLRLAEPGHGVAPMAQSRNGRERLPQSLSTAPGRSPVIDYVDRALKDAWAVQASDVHFESSREGLAVKLRVDGLLVNRDGPERELPAEEIISRIKVVAELDIAEKRVPQDGRFAMLLDGRMVDCRVSIMPSAHGEDAVVRILDKRHLVREGSTLSMQRLGFAERLAERIRALARKPHGMLLVTGPTGSGKTTTLYATLSEIRSGVEKIVTIEDPIEYELEGVLQVPVNEKKGLTFARGLRSILRHDPDVIMVGEIRDRETAEIAIQSALTGHLVFTTVHANTALDVVSRFTHMGVDLYALASGLNGVLAQRLVRLNCPHCARADPQQLRALDQHGLLGDVDFGSASPKRGTGCERCRATGFLGRTAVGELLELDDRLRDLLVSRAAIVEVKEYVKARRDESLQSAIVGLVRQGLTTLEEAQRVVELE